MRQGHPEGQLQGGGRFTAPAALLPSSLNTFLREEQVHNLRCSSLLLPRMPQSNNTEAETLLATGAATTVSF